MKNRSKNLNEFNNRFNEIASEKYIYSRSQEDQDIINDMFSSVKAYEKAKSDENSLPFDESLKRFELDKQVVQLFTDNAKEDRELKKSYAFWLLKIFIAQLIAFNTIFIMVGFNFLKYSEKTFNVYVTGGIIEIISLVAIIVKYLFKDNITETLKNVLEKNKKDK